MTALLQPLEPAGAARAARDVVGALGLRDGAGATVAAVMIATADGRASVDGRSVALGHPADRALLRTLRAEADAVLVGARTLGAERYANLLDPAQRDERIAAGLDPHPLIATISRRLDLDTAAPVFSDPVAPVAVYSEHDGEVPGAEVRVLERAGVGEVLDDLAARDARAIVCEGGPALLRELVAAGRVDHLLLTIAPLLAAGDAPAILTGEALAAPTQLALRDIHRAGDHLFLHYSRP